MSKKSRKRNRKLLGVLAAGLGAVALANRKARAASIADNEAKESGFGQMKLKDYGPHTKGGPTITQEQRDAKAKADKEKRINALLDTMGYDKARKNAAYDALIDAGQIINQRGTLSKKNINRGYTKLPTISVTSVSGTGAKLLAISDDIGSIKSVKVTDTGFRYSSTNPPEVEFRSHFIVKDVTGTFVAGNTLTTHTGTVKSWDSTTNELIVANFEDTIKVVQEQDGTFQEGIQLEQGTELLTPARFRLEQEHQNLETGFTKIVDGQEVTVDEDRIVLDAINEFDPYKIGTDIFGDFTGFLGRRATKREIINVSAEYDENSKTWAFLLDGKKRKNITFFEDVEYYFNLSDPSLYGNEIGTPIEILQKSFALSRPILSR